MGEKFSLTWYTFQMHGKNLFQQLMETGNYSDVTLVSDDQHICKAHKFVLSSCSTFFRCWTVPSQKSQLSNFKNKVLHLKILLRHWTVHSHLKTLVWSKNFPLGEEGSFMITPEF